MAARTSDSILPVPSGSDDVTALAPPKRTELATRDQLAQTRLGDAHSLVRIDPRTPSEASDRGLATRRPKAQRRRRRNRILFGIAVILAVFPPMWAVYAIAWLVWRNRPKQKSMRRVHKAVKALKKDQTGVALHALQEAHYLDPSNTDALYWVGLTLSGQQRREEAAEALSIVAERVPGLPEVEAALVDAYVAADAPEAAVYHAQRLLDAAPYAPATLLKLADAYEAADRPDLAIETLTQAPLHKPTLTPDLAAVHYRLGDLHERQGDPEQALRHFKRVYAHDITYRDIRTRVQHLETPAG